MSRFRMQLSVMRLLMMLWVGLLGLACSCQVAASPPLEVLAQTDRSIDVRLNVPDAQVVPNVALGWPWQSIQLVDLPLQHQPGAPELPVQAGLIVIPKGARVQLKVLSAEATEMSGLKIGPSVSAQPNVSKPQQVPAPPTLDKAVYEHNDWYPNTVAKLGFTGAMRGVPVAQLRFHPVQYNPVTETARVYRQITIRVHFDRPYPSQDQSATAVQQATTPNPFAAIYAQSLLNPEARP